MMLLQIISCKDDTQITTYPDLTLSEKEVNLKVKENIDIKIISGSEKYEVINSDDNVIDVKIKDKEFSINALSKGVSVVVVKDIKTKQSISVVVKVEGYEKQNISDENSNQNIGKKDEQKDDSDEGTNTNKDDDSKQKNNNYGENSTENQKDDNKGNDDDVYIEFTTNKNIGENIKLTLNALGRYRKNVWIDLNNNGVKDVGENRISFDNEKYSYKIQSKTIRIYGRITSFHACSCYHEEYTTKCYPNSDKEMTKIVKLDVSNNSYLEEIDCSNNNLTSLDLSRNINLKKIDCSDNELVLLNISNNQQLITLDCSSNNLTSLDISNSYKLLNLYCGGNQLAELNIRNNNKLGVLSCGGNENFKELDFSNTQLDYLYCGGNKNLKTLKVSNNSKLRELYFDNNIQLEMLNISKNPQLKSFNYKNCPNLMKIDASNNNFYSITCENGNLTTLDITNNKNLKSLCCDNNNLVELDVSTNINLKSLSCSGNKLTYLDLSKCTKLGLGKDENSYPVYQYSFVCINNPDLGCIKVNKEQKKLIDNYKNKPDAYTDGRICSQEEHYGTIKWCRDKTAYYSLECN